MKNFRMNLKQNETVLRKSIGDFKNDAVKSIAEKIINSENQVGGTSPWLKAHGDVTWTKA
jgi:hypothetical protein